MHACVLFELAEGMTLLPTHYTLRNGGYVCVYVCIYPDIMSGLRVYESWHTYIHTYMTGATNAHGKP
jgi:hypothetical protein